MISYLSTVVVFFAALLAVKGGTWDGNKVGIKKITPIGYLTIALAIAGLTVSILSVYNTKQTSFVREQKIESMSVHAKLASDRAVQLKEQLNRSIEHSKTVGSQLEASIANEEQLKSQISLLQNNLKQANDKIDHYKDILDVIKSQSTRQPQQTMAKYVDLNRNPYWEAPSYIYGGSIVKLYGFKSDVAVAYSEDVWKVRQIKSFANRCADNNRYYVVYVRCLMHQCRSSGLRVNIVEGSSRVPAEIAIIGVSGRKMHWGIFNLGRARYEGGDPLFEGKVFVTSTPRTRSSGWSWVEDIPGYMAQIKKGDVVLVNVSKLNVRRKPDVNSNIVCVFPKSSTLTVYDKVEMWLLVGDKEHSKGWVHGGYVKRNE